MMESMTEFGKEFYREVDKYKSTSVLRDTMSKRKRALTHNEPEQIINHLNTSQFLLNQPSALHASVTANSFAALNNAGTNNLDLENEDFSVADMSEAGISTLADEDMSTSQKNNNVINKEEPPLEIKQLYLAYPSHTNYIDFLLARRQPSEMIATNVAVVPSRSTSHIS
eukprot:9366567-Ditylum_brightwellii.AAC.2